MKCRAVFLDRDGTINLDPGYLGDPEQVRLFPDTGKVLGHLKNDLNFKLIVISNQSGIARGLITAEDVDAVNNKINELLSKNNVSIDHFYYCPFHPDFNTAEECKCRKPSPDMVIKAASEFNIDLSVSYFIGDSISDIQCGKNAGVKTILVKTSPDDGLISALKKENIFPNFVAVNLEDACNFIQKDFNGEI